VPAERGAAAESWREPQAVREGVSRVFGIERVIWLGRGVAGDDTHGHVDDIARFVGAETIVTAVEPETKMRIMSR